MSAKQLVPNLYFSDLNIKIFQRSSITWNDYISLETRWFWITSNSQQPISSQYKQLDDLIGWFLFNRILVLWMKMAFYLLPAFFTTWWRILVWVSIHSKEEKVSIVRMQVDQSLQMSSTLLQLFSTSFRSISNLWSASGMSSLHLLFSTSSSFKVFFHRQIFLFLWRRTNLHISRHWWRHQRANYNYAPSWSMENWWRHVGTRYSRFCFWRLISFYIYRDLCAAKRNDLFAAERRFVADMFTRFQSITASTDLSKLQILRSDVDAVMTSLPHFDEASIKSIKVGRIVSVTGEKVTWLVFKKVVFNVSKFKILFILSTNFLISMIHFQES